MRLKDCPVRTMVDVIEGKWKPLIVVCLKGGPKRFGELRRGVPEASRKVLTEQLRELERDQIVGRRVSGTAKALRVDYSVTPYGRTLVKVLTAMAGWGTKHRRLKSAGKLERSEGG
jgi:DNA-binding HxlR family transcriptional regulator